MRDPVLVLDKGYVSLDDSMASDLSVVNAARVSFAKYKEQMGEDDEGLVRFLISNRHGTPFEHNAFRFVVKCPIFVAREWFRHRIGSFNEMSGRYTVMEGEFYVPAPEQIRSQVGKPGSYTFEPVGDELADDVRKRLAMAYGSMWGVYQNLLGDGIAKEVARLVLPVSIYTQFHWTVNARSLMNFLSLRTHETAMWEIRQYANAIESMFQEAMPVTHAAWVANGKVAP